MTEDNDPTEYKPFRPDCASEGQDYTGDKCPNCGNCLRVDDIAVNSDGNKTELGYTEASAAGDNLWCEKCWEKVAGQTIPMEQSTLRRFK